MIPKKSQMLKGATWSVLNNNTTFSVWPWKHSEAEAQAKGMHRKPAAMRAHSGVYERLGN